jgi:hypothetical protein
MKKKQNGRIEQHINFMVFLLMKQNDKELSKVSYVLVFFFVVTLFLIETILSNNDLVFFYEKIFMICSFEII